MDVAHQYGHQNAEAVCAKAKRQSYQQSFDAVSVAVVLNAFEHRAV